MIKNIFKMLLITSIATSSLFALKKDTLVEQMSTEINKVQKILIDKSLEKKQQREKIIKIIDEIFDYEIMARISLGREWGSITDKQRKDFSEVFENKIKNSYVEKLDLYTDEKVIIKELTEYKNTRLILNTEIIGKKDTYVINYKFYENKNKNEWMVYDVDILGVSIIQTYRQQFSGLLKEKSFDELIEALKK